MSSTKSATLHRCPICETPLQVDGVVAQSFSPMHGLVVTLGYSRGGWGSRETPFEFSGEVCEECFTVLADKMLEVRGLYKSRLGINPYRAKTASAASVVTQAASR